MVKKEEALALGGQKCMMCNKNTLSLTESSQDIPFLMEGHRYFLP